MVFQSYALYPHLSVFDNIAFGLKIQKVPKAEIEQRVNEASRALDLDQYLQRKPRALSGGQRQRVAMGRAIVRKPAAFLMDEPLSNLDAKLRVQTRAEIAKLQQDLGVTTIYVTHDQTEALTMGHRVAVMRKGELQQVAPPQELYDRPVNLFVGGFIGSPSMNMLEATLVKDGDGFRADLGSQSLTLDAELVAARTGLRAYEGQEVILGIRPEELEDAALVDSAPADRRLRGILRLREALGSEIMAHLEVDARPAQTDEARELAAETGLASLDESKPGATVVGRLGPRSKVAVGDTVEVFVDTRNLHFFDPRTGLGIYDQAPGDLSTQPSPLSPTKELT
jgi:multiple sugar transport system ATP-binding protein